MTPKEAIRDLRKLKSFHNGSYGAAVDMAIDALEKQIPKKAGKKVFVFARCPVCGSPVECNEDYCFHCGQAIDWSEDE